MATPLHQILTQLEPDNIIQFLQQHHLIHNVLQCLCGANMNVAQYGRNQDGVIFRCPDCRKTKSIRTDSFFAQHNLSISHILQLAFLWIIETPVTSCASLIGVSEATAIHFYQLFRDICSAKLLQVQPLLGANGNIVEIDESLMFKRKNNVGHVVQQYWIFGVYDTVLKRGFLQHVNDRSAATLIPIIQRVVAPGATIFSDEWRAYNGLAGLGFNHQTVNHQHHFTDPVTGASTNHVESFWSRIKRRLKYVSGSQGEMRWAHLDEAIYRHWYGMVSTTPIMNYNLFLQHISDIYPV